MARHNFLYNVWYLHQGGLDVLPFLERFLFLASVEYTVVLREAHTGCEYMKESTGNDFISVRCVYIPIEIDSKS